MCLIIARKKNPGFIFKKPTIATGDILVYKFCIPRGYTIHTFFRDFPCIPINNYSWKLEEDRLPCVALRSITTGIHSYTKINSSLFRYYAIIPCGSKYYVGKSNEVVSDKLIIYKDLTSLILEHPLAKTLII